MKKVYVTIGVDIIHHGHINIIEQARKLGEVTVGLMTDKALVCYKRPPLLTYAQRKKVIENIKGVDVVIPQEELDYVPNLRKYKPDFLVHGSDWQKGIQRQTRTNALNALKEWGGELIEPNYTEDVVSDILSEKINAIGTTPQIRLGRLRQLLDLKPLVRILEVHNGLTARIAEETQISKMGKVFQFDGMWESSLTDSASKGKPDIELVDFTSRFQTIDQILEVTNKPMIVDGDTGGLIEHFRFTVKTLERLGVSAVIIEDKIGPKRNSLFGTEVAQKQDNIDHFCEKISEGKKAQVGNNFMIIARIESLILKQGLDDALERAAAYINAGADGIMIHSNKKTPDEVLAFCKRYNDLDQRVPLVAVPTSYSQIKEEQLIEAGVNVVIYANHLLRSAYPAMVKTAKSILYHQRAKEASENCLSIKEILTLIPGGK